MPAVPQPFRRVARLRPGRRPVRLGRRRRELQRGRLRPVRLPAKPVRRRPGRRGRHAHAALGRGRRAAQPGPALCRRSGQPWWQHHPHRPRDGRGPSRQPGRGQRGSERPPHRRPGIAQPDAHHHAAGDRRAVGRRRGLGPGRGGQPADQPHRRRGRQLRLALLRGSGSPGQLRRGQPVAVRGALHERDALGALFLLPPLRPGGPGRAMRRGQLVDHRRGLRLLRRRPLSRRLRRRAVLRRLHAQLHLDAPRGRRHIAQRGREDDLRGARPEPGRSADLAQRRAVLRGLQRGHDPAHRLLGRQPAPGRRRVRRSDQRAGFP